MLKLRLTKYSKIIVFSAVLLVGLITTSLLLKDVNSFKEPLELEVKASSLEVSTGYTAKAYLVNIKTFEKLKYNGKEVVATKEFIADKPEKDIILTFPKFKNSKKVDKDVYDFYVTLDYTN